MVLVDNLMTDFDARIAIDLLKLQQCKDVKILMDSIETLLRINKATNDRIDSNMELVAIANRRVDALEQFLNMPVDKS